MKAAGTTRDKDVVTEARRLIGAAAAERIGLWAIGGAAIHLLAGDALHRGLTRELKDIDLVARARQRHEAASLLAREGYQPDEEFNALQGASRLLFWDPEHERQLDVFVERFAMCHEVPLEGRLHEGRPTLPGPLQPRRHPHDERHRQAGQRPARPTLPNRR